MARTTLKQEIWQSFWALCSDRFWCGRRAGGPRVVVRMAAVVDQSGLRIGR
jgi:hypothetical protein